jgi:hypothetical protein
MSALKADIRRFMNTRPSSSGGGQERRPSIPPRRKLEGLRKLVAPSPRSGPESGRRVAVRSTDSHSPRKRSPDTLPRNVEAQVHVRWPYGGQCLNGLAVSDASLTSSHSDFSRSDGQHRNADLQTVNPQAKLRWAAPKLVPHSQCAAWPPAFLFLVCP